MLLLPARSLGFKMHNLHRTIFTEKKSNFTDKVSLFRRSDKGRKLWITFLWKKIHFRIFFICCWVERSHSAALSFTRDLHFKDKNTNTSWQLKQVTAQMSSQQVSHGKGTVSHFPILRNENSNILEVHVVYWKWYW